MPGPSFKAFNEKSNSQQLKVLTLAAMYPSKVQPWMINHLYQIEKNGGQNRIISVETEDYTFDKAFSEFDFANYYWHMGSERKEQLVNAVKQFRHPQILKNTCKLLSQSNWPDSVKKKIRHGLNAYSFTLKPDVIHSHSEIAGFRFLNLIEANGAPLVHTFHGQTPVGVPSISTEARERYTENARAILVNTQFAKQQYEALGAKNSNFIIIPQGIDLSKWDFAPLTPPAKNEPLHILTVGRIVEEKGHKYVIEALRLLTEKGVNACYHIVGRGPELSNLQQQTKALGLTDKVIFHGVLTGQALKKQYAQSHIFVLPSLKADGYLWEETQGVVVQEAQASGRLVIGADSGGIPESILDGENGFIVPDRNPKALAYKVIDIVNAPEKWQAWQQSGRKWTQSHYDLELVGAKVYDVYKNI